jgi:hypothetical protein
MVDPITLALIRGGVSLASGIAGGIGARRQAAREEDRADKALERAKELKDAAMAARESYGMGPSYSDLRQLVMQDPTSDYLRQQALRQEAGQLQALAGGGARALLGGTQAVAGSTANRMAQIAAQEQQRKVAGLQTVGQAEQRIAEQRLADARGDLALGRGLEAEGLAAQAGARDLKAAGTQQMIQAGIQGLGAYALGRESGFFGGERSATDTTVDTEDQTNDPALQAAILDGRVTMRDILSGNIDMDQLRREYAFADTYENTEGLSLGTQATRGYKDGGIMRGKTPGEFSHDSNPIDIMQDGAKIGEMTGGEGIVSPEDLGKLEQLAGEGKTSLHKFVRRLIKKLENNSNG